MKYSPLPLAPVLLLIFTALSTFADPTPDPIYVQAHRGGLREVPENTMAAYYQAWRLGTIPEIDIRTTSDGVIICLHDSTLKRTTNARDQADVPVSQLTLTELQRYDAGGWFDPAFAHERIPTLKQVFQVLQRHRDYQIYLDLKAVELSQLAALIETYQVADQIIFCHNRIDSCKTMKAAIPQLRTMLWIGGHADAIWRDYQAAAATGFTHLDQVQLHLKPTEDTWPFALSQEQLRTAVAETREAGIDLEVLPFEFTPQSLRELVTLGIQWYATDEPRRFRAALRGERATASFLNNGITAHRGDSGTYPENTLAAIDAAIALGADWVEVDVFKAADGHLVVTHDATTERFGDKTLDVATSTLAELQAIDVATGFRNDKQLDDTLCPPATMPTLKQVVQRIQLQQRTRLSIQPKMNIVDDAIALVRTLRAESWVGFNDGDLKKMARVKELAPAIPVFWDRFKESPLTEDMVTARKHGFESLVPHVGALNPAIVAQMKDAGFAVGAWTVNDTKTMQWLLDMGVDRIYTDYPDRLRSLK